jgi:hypothetical protein
MLNVVKNFKVIQCIVQAVFVFVVKIKAGSHDLTGRQPPNYMVPERISIAPRPREIRPADAEPTSGINVPIIPVGSVP